MYFSKLYICKVSKLYICESFKIIHKSSFEFIRMQKFQNCTYVKFQNYTYVKFRNYKHVIYAWSRDRVGGTLPKSSRTAVGHTRPSVQWVLGFFPGRGGEGVKWPRRYVDHSFHQAPRLRNVGATHLLLL
jgi:hypothetical protein